jgi:leader peptidase (prepilin peptidase)/N-methyltransferase
VPREPFEIRRVKVGAEIFVPVPAGTAPAPAPVRRDVPPLALVAGAGLTVLAILRLGTGPHALLAAWLLPVLASLAAVDARSRVLPNRIVLPALLAALAWQLAFFPGRWAEWIGAGLGAGFALLLPSLIRPGAIGMGDVKLVVLLGVALGADVVSALTLGLLAAVPAALFILLRGGAAARHSSFAYGPFLALGAAVVLLA